MNTKYWEEEIETMSRKKLQELQLERLKKTINISRIVAMSFCEPRSCS